MEFEQFLSQLKAMEPDDLLYHYLMAKTGEDSIQDRIPSDFYDDALRTLNVLTEAAIDAA